MKTGLNLISQEGKERVKLLRLKLKLKRYVSLLVLIFVLISAVTLGLFLLFSKKLDSNNLRISSLENQIREFNKTESSLATVINRASGIGSVMSKRKLLSDDLSKLSVITGPGFNFEAIDLNIGQNAKIESVCSDIQALSNFYTRMENAKEKKIFNNIVYDQVGRSIDGKYKISFEVIE